MTLDFNSFADLYKTGRVSADQHTDGVPDLFSISDDRYKQITDRTEELINKFQDNTHGDWMMASMIEFVFRGLDNLLPVTTNEFCFVCFHMGQVLEQVNAHFASPFLLTSMLG